MSNVVDATIAPGTILPLAGHVAPLNILDCENILLMIWKTVLAPVRREVYISILMSESALLLALQVFSYSRQHLRSKADRS